jgi:hypothetical protein
VFRYSLFAFFLQVLLWIFASVVCVISASESTDHIMDRTDAMVAFTVESGINNFVHPFGEPDENGVHELNVPQMEAEIQQEAAEFMLAHESPFPPGFGPSPAAPPSPNSEFQELFGFPSVNAVAPDGNVVPLSTIHDITDCVPVPFIMPLATRVLRHILLLRENVDSEVRSAVLRRLCRLVPSLIVLFYGTSSLPGYYVTPQTIGSLFHLYAVHVAPVSQTPPPFSQNEFAELSLQIFDMLPEVHDHGLLHSGYVSFGQFMSPPLYYAHHAHMLFLGLEHQPTTLLSLMAFQSNPIVYWLTEYASINWFGGSFFNEHTWHTLNVVFHLPHSPTQFHYDLLHLAQVTGGAAIDWQAAHGFDHMFETSLDSLNGIVSGIMSPAQVFSPQVVPATPSPSEDSEDGEHSETGSNSLMIEGDVVHACGS